MRRFVLPSLLAGSVMIGVGGQAIAAMAPLLSLPAEPSAVLKVPPGFKVNVFARLTPAGADYFRGPRMMAFSPEGHLYLSLGSENKVVMLPDRDHDGRADEVVTIAGQFNAPQGLAFVNGKLLVANQDSVVVVDNDKATPLIPNLPVGGHTMKTLKVGPDGYLYLTMGSSCNVCEESNPLRASILRYSTDGKPAGALQTLGRHAQSPIWANGLRNSEGFAWHPQSGAMFATNNGADMRSDSKGGAPVDEIPPEHLNRIEAGQHYGWPYCWGDHVADPNFPGPESFCASTNAPAFTFMSHAAPLGITFLNKAKLPAEYRSDALVALHGSWNRRQPSGYKVVRVHFDQDKPVGESDFMTGFIAQGGAWGRPVDVLVGPDGAVYVSDDRAGLVYRVIYSGKLE